MATARKSWDRRIMYHPRFSVCYPDIQFPLINRMEISDVMTSNSVKTERKKYQTASASNLRMAEVPRWLNKLYHLKIEYIWGWDFCQHGQFTFMYVHGCRLDWQGKYHLYIIMWFFFFSLRWASGRVAHTQCQCQSSLCSREHCNNKNNQTDWSTPPDNHQWVKWTADWPKGVSQLRSCVKVEVDVLGSPR